MVARDDLEDLKDDIDMEILPLKTINNGVVLHRKYIGKLFQSNVKTLRNQASTNLIGFVYIFLHPSDEC